MKNNDIKLFSILIALFGLAVLIITLLISNPLGQSAQGKELVIYVAPTLKPITEEAINDLKIKADMRVMGSVAAAQLIREGRIPDVWLTVDAELLRLVSNYLRYEIIGSYRLILVCREPTSLIEIYNRRIGIANPNIAPIGYRAVAALYYLAEKYNYIELNRLLQDLNVFVDNVNGSIVLDLTRIDPRHPFIMRNEMSEVGSMLETGAADCIFAYEPFAIARSYPNKYHVIHLPVEIEFVSDPPFDAIAKLDAGLVKIIRFKAIAIAFSEDGDKFLTELKKVDSSKYGFLNTSRQ